MFSTTDGGRRCAADLGRGHLKGAPALGWIGQTRDGTVFGRPHADQNAIFLSTGVGATREWIKVTLSRS